MNAPSDIWDCDIHPYLHSSADLEPWLSRQWIEHQRNYGSLRQTPLVTGSSYHKSQPNAGRRDAYPPAGGTYFKRAPRPAGAQINAFL